MTIDSSAPSIRPENSKSTSACGRYITYTYWKPKALKTGEIVYHQHNSSKKIIIRDTKKKNNLIREFKSNLTRNPDFLVEDFERLLDFARNNPNRLKQVILQHNPEKYAIC
jgi:hypothetical protein